MPIDRLRQASDRVNHWLVRGSDLLLAAAVILILAMMIVPLPTWAIDVLIALNISISAVILLSALYLPDAAKFPSFPTILLLTTLFRLAINVSSTRLVLLQADAGAIISAFGEFVVQGSYVVGAVIFLILVVIQFVVIAKGSERADEVAARFNLDALPGKQMSIDADRNAGQIDHAQASARRRSLEKESQFYGAMEGAMKFVKGDAIAGIIIALINVVGGIAVGKLNDGQASIAALAEVYTLLTIGDGLVSQIPALLICTAAGLVVTRVAQADGPAEQGVARDIFDQLTRRPRALLSVVALLVLLGFLPGFPAWVFWTLAALFSVTALPRLWKDDPARGGAPSEEGAGNDEHVPATSPAAGAARIQLPPPHPAPVRIDVHASLSGVMLPKDPGEMRACHKAIQALRGLLADEMGLVFPYPDIQIGLGLPAAGFVIRVFDYPVASGTIQATNAVLLPSGTDPPAEDGGRSFPMPDTGAPATLIPLLDGLRRRRDRNKVLTPREFILAHLAAVVRRHAADFIGVQETRVLLNHLEERFPALVQEVLPARLNLQQITEILQRLLREQIPIRDLRQIMESLARWSQKSKDPADLSEYVRRDLARVVSARFSVNGELPAYVLHESVERDLHECLRTGPAVGGSTSMMALNERILRGAQELMRGGVHEGSTPVLLTRGMFRRHLRGLLDAALPQLAVVCYEELAPGLRRRVLGRIGEPAAEHLR